MKKPRVKLIVDGTIDVIKGLKESDFKRVGIHLFSDGVEVSLSTSEFFERLINGEVFTTSQPSPEEFLKAFPKSDCLVLTISSKLSGTFNSAVVAKKLSGRSNVFVIDSKTSSIGLGLLARETVKLINEGLSLNELVPRVKALRDRISTFIVLSDINYLIRSGRVSKAVGLLGRLVKLKPVLEVKDGFIKGTGKLLVFNQLIKELTDFILSRKNSGEVFLAHNNMLNEVTELSDLLEAQGLKVFVKDFVGFALSAHLGYKGLGFCWLD